MFFYIGINFVALFLSAAYVLTFSWQKLVLWWTSDLHVLLFLFLNKKQYTLVLIYGGMLPQRHCDNIILLLWFAKAVDYKDSITKTISDFCKKNKVTAKDKSRTVGGATETVTKIVVSLVAPLWLIVYNYVISLFFLSMETWWVIQKDQICG